LGSRVESELVEKVTVAVDIFKRWDRQELEGQVREWNRQRPRQGW
jgi:hypothetical protein